VKKQYKLASIASIVVILVIVGCVLAFAGEGSEFHLLLRKKKMTDIGGAIAESFQAGQDVIVAYVDGTPIYQNEVSLKRTLNQASYDFITHDPTYGKTYAGLVTLMTDDEILAEIVQFKLIEKAAEKAGIIVTDEEARERARGAPQESDAEAERSAERRESSELNEVFLKGLGMTSEEYINSIGAQIARETMIKTQYVVWFCQKEMNKRQEDSKYVPQNYTEHLDELLKAADFRLAVAKDD